MIGRLQEKINIMQAPIVVGLDPQLAMLPPQLLDDAVKEEGESLAAVASAVMRFNRAVIDAICDLVPCVKPQAAMYEQFGLPGMAAFADCVHYAHEKGLFVIGDVKRGDIGSTSAAYATAHLGTLTVGTTLCTAFDEDMATVNPYLGTDGIEPFLKVCREEDKGIFVLVKTSNPSSGEFQDREIDGKPLYHHVAEKVAAWAASCRGADGISNVGAVVGATYPAVGARMREVLQDCLLLVPGYGAQGGTAEDLKVFFRADGSGAIVNSSRGITAAWQQDRYAKFGATAYADAARAAVCDMRDDIQSALKRG